MDKTVLWRHGGGRSFFFDMNIIIKGNPYKDRATAGRIKEERFN